jgi:hypothetical protein
MCAPRVTRRTSILYSSSCHTRVNMGVAIFSLHTSHRLAAEMWNTMKNSFMGKQFLSCSFYLYRFRKYVSYGFSNINVCDPRVHDETPCISLSCCYFSSSVYFSLFTLFFSSHSLSSSSSLLFLLIIGSLISSSSFPCAVWSYFLLTVLPSS